MQSFVRVQADTMKIVGSWKTHEIEFKKQA